MGKPRQAIIAFFLFSISRVISDAAALTGDRSSATLSVEVRAEASKPIPAAEVEITAAAAAGPAGAPAPLRRLSGQDGRVLFDKLPPGRYRLQVSAKGYVRRTLGAVLLPNGARQSLSVDLVPGFSLSGTVTDPSGKRIEKAEACVLLEKSRRPFEESRGKAESNQEASKDPLASGHTCAKSGPGGKILFPLLPRGRYRLTVRGADFVPLVRILEMNGPLPPQQWRLQAGGSIGGRLLDREEHGVAKARVLAHDRLREAAGGKDREVLTGADGRFVIKGLPPGSWRVLIEPRDAAAITIDGILVKAGATTPLGDLRLRPGLTLEGKIVGPNGDPLPGAEVRVHQKTGTYRLLRQAKSDAQGGFRAAGLPEGKVDLVVIPPKGFAPHREEGITPPRADLKIQLEEAGRIAGAVIVQQGLLPAHVTVRAGSGSTIPGAPPAVARTDEVDPETGRFLLEGVLPAELVEVEARAAGFWSESVKITVEPGREAGPVELVLQRGVSIEGKATDKSGAPIGGALVKSESGAAGFTDPGGNFRLEGLLPGAQEIEASHPEFAPARLRLSLPLPEGERVSFQLGRGGAVEGTVTDMDGAPVDGVSISIGKEGPQASQALTDAAGRYRIEHLPAGPQRVMRRAGGQWEDTETRTIELAEGETATVDFHLGKILTGRITRAGAPVAGAFVGLGQPKGWSNTSMSDFSAQNTFTDADGHFRLSGAPSGWATITVLDGSQHVTKPVEVPPGREAQLDVSLPDRLIQGQVVAAKDDKPLPGANVSGSLKKPSGAPASSSSSTSVETDDLGQSVTVELTVGGRVQTTADRDGRFTLFLESADKQQVWTSLYGYAYQDVEVDPGRSEPVTIRLGRTGKLKVHLSDLQGRPLDHSSICIFQRAGGQSSQMCQTDTSPSSNVEIREGTYTLVAGSPGFATQVLENRESHIDPEGHPDEIDLKLGPGAILRLRLPGASPDKARVASLKDPAGRERSILVEDAGIDPATGDKRWSTWALEPGEWQITADPGDGKLIRKSVTVVPGPDIEVLLP